MILQFLFIMVVTASNPIVLNLQSTSWSELGYPILDTPVAYPFEDPLASEVLGDKWVLYDEGPEGINHGDLYRLQLNTAQYKVNGAWYHVGALFPDGKYLRVASDFVDNTNLSCLEADDHIDFEEAENKRLEIVNEIGQEFATDDMVIQHYLLVLSSYGKQLDEERKHVIPVEDND